MASSFFWTHLPGIFASRTRRVGDGFLDIRSWVPPFAFAFVSWTEPGVFFFGAGALGLE